ncbi:MAG TPA: 5-formyltetrahydrofolate cyclo-ligase [Clostridiales bacterium]|nr:5-formyltetrahydrofolate cyclo-ligase [Clostridiales bacterium]
MITDSPAQDTCSLQKAQLRRQMIARREQMTAEECQLAAEGFRSSLPELLFKTGLGGRRLRIAAYAAMRQEADLSLACQDLAAAGHDIYFPAVRGRGAAAQLVFAKLPDGLPINQFLQPGCFGVCEPPEASWMTELPHFDMILLPGLAFDRQGNRLGWGRAFYDRLLASLQVKPCLAGVCYPFQIVPDSVPSKPTDFPVDWLLIPEDQIHCNSFMKK